MLHEAGIVHCDVKPENILMGLRNFSGVAHLVDFGLGNTIYDKNGSHIKVKTGLPLIGTAAFASPNSHMGYELSRRDDLISLGYLVYYMFYGSLPWIFISDLNSSRCGKVAQIKACFTKGVEASMAPKAFKDYLEYCLELDFDEIPDYKMLLGLIENLAAEKGIDLFDNCFDWNILKAS